MAQPSTTPMSKKPSTGTRSEYMLCPKPDRAKEKGGPVPFRSKHNRASGEPQAQRCPTSLGDRCISEDVTSDLLLCSPPAILLMPSGKNGHQRRETSKRWNCEQPNTLDVFPDRNQCLLLSGGGAPPHVPGRRDLSPGTLAPGEAPGLLETPAWGARPSSSDRKSPWSLCPQPHSSCSTQHPVTPAKFA